MEMEDGPIFINLIEPRDPDLPMYGCACCLYRIGSYDENMNLTISNNWKTAISEFDINELSVNCQAKINKNSHIKLSNYSQIENKLLSVGIIQHSSYLQLNI